MMQYLFWLIVSASRRRHQAQLGLKPPAPAAIYRWLWLARTRWHWGVWGGLALFILFVPFPNLTPPTARVIHITASSFEYAPANITVNPGDLVTLELTTTDYIHGLWLDDYDLEVSAEAGQPARLTFVADRPGVFRFRCSVTCGPLHPFMLGTLSVGPNTLWWRATGLTLWLLVAIVGAFRR